MSIVYKKALFIFRRDLRMQDNSALQQACAHAESVVPCFIFDPVQVSTKNDYRSMNAMQYMVEAIDDLYDQCKKTGGKLHCFYGNTIDIIAKLLRETKAEALFVNSDYTPFSVKRDKELVAVCKRYSVEFHDYHDVLLQAPDVVLKKDKTPYAVFTPFYKASSSITVVKPQKLKVSSWFTVTIPQSIARKEIRKKILGSYDNKEVSVHGGRMQAQSILRKLEDYKAYAKTRDMPFLATTRLSAHLKFGVVSVREVYYAIEQTLGAAHPLLRQLYWRDFWTYIAYHTPRVFGQAYHEKYNKLEWSKSKTMFEKWCAGQTGFPIVDAGMRELNTTGFMHNRVRMIVASFLTKDLHISWQWGEKYFAQQLVDYDPCVNNGNWQWSASTGCDGQPYFRIFNPWLQQKKFDPDCDYIKQWVPELADVEPRIIHKAESYDIEGYPAPCVDHKVESAKAKVWYKKVQ